MKQNWIVDTLKNFKLITRIYCSSFSEEIIVCYSHTMSCKTMLQYQCFLKSRHTWSDSTSLIINQWLSIFLWPMDRHKKYSMDHFALLAPYEQLVQTVLHIDQWIFYKGFKELPVHHQKFQMDHRWPTWIKLRLTVLYWTKGHNLEFTLFNVTEAR